MVEKGNMHEVNMHDDWMGEESGNLTNMSHIKGMVGGAHWLWTYLMCHDFSRLQIYACSLCPCHVFCKEKDVCFLSCDMNEVNIYTKYFACLMLWQ